LKNYFAKHAFSTITTEQFLAYYRANLVPDNSEEAKRINIMKWIYEAGLPDNYVKITSTRFEEVDRQVEKWKNGTAPSALVTQKFTTNEWLRFLNTLPENISKEQMKSLDDAFHFSSSGNAEILFAWFEHVIPSAYVPAYPSLENFLVNVGRRKFVKPLFSALAKTDEGKRMAKDIYAKARPNYHSVTANTVDEILGMK
jgi:hypothetical protein